MRWKTTMAWTFAVALPALAVAQPPGHPGAWGHRPGFDADRMEDRLDERAEHLAKLLDLTPDQQAAFQKVRDEGMATARADMDKTRLLGDELRVLLDGDRPDAAAVGAKVIELHRLHEQLRQTRESALAQLEKLLTPEQSFALKALRELREEGRANGHGFGHGPGFDRDPDGPPPAAD